MKTRNSSGVGQKIDLSFDVDTLRIFDDGSLDEGQTGGHANSPNKLLDSIKAKSTVTPGNPTNEESKIRADVKSTKLKGLLNQIKTS